MSQVFKQDLTDNSVRTVLDINLGEYASGTRQLVIDERCEHYE